MKRVIKLTLSLLVVCCILSQNISASAYNSFLGEFYFEQSTYTIHIPTSGVVMVNTRAIGYDYITEEEIQQGYVHYGFIMPNPPGLSFYEGLGILVVTPQARPGLVGIAAMYEPENGPGAICTTDVILVAS